MSAGGYSITNNGGRLDDLILGNDILKQRIAYVRSRRAEMIRQGQLSSDEANPSLGDIEQTHIIFMHAQFKSYASTNFEYYKANVQGGTGSLKLNAPTAADFQIPQYGDFIADTVLHIILNYPTLTTANTDWLIRMCDYPGLRLVQRAAITVNSNVLDEYDQEVGVFTKQFNIPSHKQAAFDRCVGQQEMLLCPQTSIAQVAMNNPTGSPTVAGPRMWAQFTNGPQTPRFVAETANMTVEMFVPLFLFHMDIRLAIPTVCLPSSSRFFNLSLASTQQLFGFAPANTTANVTAGHPYNNMTGAVINTLELYINNIFIHDDVHDIFIERVGFNLVRVHKAQDFNLNTGSENQQISQFKFPTETIYVGVRPIANLTAEILGSTSAVEQTFLTNWYKYSSFTNTAVNVKSSDNDGTATTLVNIPSLAFQVPSYTRTLGTLGLISQGVELYKPFPAGFYDSYLPWNYGGSNICAPKVGDGALAAFFNFYPGTYQPSGYINISRSQQFFYNYVSNFISSTNVCTASFRSVALNFLVITDGNAYIRYIT